MFRCSKLFWKSIKSSIFLGDGNFFNNTITPNTDQKQLWAFYLERKSNWWNGQPSHPSLTLLRCCRPYWKISWLLGSKINLKHLSEICKEEWAKIRYTRKLRKIVIVMLLRCWLETAWILLSLLQCTKTFFFQCYYVLYFRGHFATVSLHKNEYFI